MYLTHLIFSPLSGKWYKMISATMSITPAPKFFEPVRRTAIMNLLGYLPILNARGAITGVSTLHHRDPVLSNNLISDLPVVTYISRQAAGRRLSNADHEGLIQALRELENEGVCKINVVAMETMDVKEQVAVVARSTVCHLIFSCMRVLYLFWGAHRF
jgi:hypothetical protein